jgi:hypothetical protein
MWRSKRRAKAESTATAVAQAPPPPRARPAPAALNGQSVDQIRDQIETLTATNRTAPDPETERRLVRLRHLAGIKLVQDAGSTVEFAPADSQPLPAAHPLPEIAAANLTPGLVRAAILRDGCVLVRGLTPREDAIGLAELIDQAFGERESHDEGKSSTDGFYDEFAPEEHFGDVVGRGWIKMGGGLLAADSPKLHFEMMEMFRAAGLPELISGYLGEPALVSVHKTTLRKADPSVPGAWHQDGFFMGDVRALNLWLALSRCGDEAPGLDIVPRRIDNYLATATDEAILDYTISQAKVDETAGETPVIRPIFEPGDALLFDELFLHKTGSDPEMPKPRYAVENWFFGGSGFPDEYAPIVA